MKRLAVWTVAAGALLAAAANAVVAQDAWSDAQKKGTLLVCADPFNFPASTNGATGFDVDVIRTILARADVHPTFVWVNTATRGGLGRALRHSISKGACDLFLGIAISDEQAAELAEKDLTFTVPYLGMGYVLVVQGAAADARTLADVQDIKVGVSMSTPVDGYLFDIGIDRELYFRNRRLLEGLTKQEVDAGMVWSPALGIARRDFSEAVFKPATDYVPEPNLRWNNAFVVKAADVELKQFIDESINALIANGEIEKIIEGYGIPYYPPFE